MTGMGWAGRLFDARDTFFRFLLLDLTGLGYLVFDRSPTGPQWILAGLAFAAGLLLHRRQPVNLAVQATLLAVALYVLENPTINEVGTAWALGELALWAPHTRQIWFAAAATAGIYLIFAPLHPRAVLLNLAVRIGMPVLLGTVIRTSRELAVQAERRNAADHRAARADERGAIARELHDVVAHHVASMVLRIGVARHVLPGLDPKVAEVFDDVHATGTTALADLRRLVAVLRDPDGVRPDAALTAIEPSALPAALDGAVQNARRAGLVVEAEIDPEVGALDAVRGLAVLRLTQEALTNVAKHAGSAARARLVVAVRDGDVHWEVADDGGGVALSRMPGGGHGLIGMRERVSVLGGALSAGPDGKGWRVGTVLPASM